MKRHVRNLIRLLHEELGSLPIAGCEVGVWRGELSEALLREFPLLRLHMVDTWERADPDTMCEKLGGIEDHRAAKEQCLGRTRFALGRRVVLQLTSTEAARSMIVDDGCLDFCFVDADHACESVKADVRAWWPKVRPGGLLCGHDYDGVGDRSGRYGVKRAVDEWAGTEGIRVGTRPGLIWWAKKAGAES